jgi:serine/threonine-protein kinase
MSVKNEPLIDDDAEAATLAIPVRASTPAALAQPPTQPAQVEDAAESADRTPSGSHNTSLSSFSGSPALVGGRYQILRLLGAGGMGSVYEARDAELDEIVALKTLRRELIEDADMLDRFRNEVRLARRVTHKNVARMFDIGEHGGEKFLTMEFVDGESLAAVLEREKRLPIGRVVEIITAVCAGLSAAHAAGVIHRDLKPDNVMLARDGRVLVADFGIARAAHAEGGKTMGMVLGTPAYMAPEQVLGEKNIDARADIYALGAMLFELFTGEDAWTGDTAMGIATARLLAPPPDPRQRRKDIPDGAARVIMRCMAKARDERYASTDQVARDLNLLTLPVAQPLDAAVTLVRDQPAALKGPTSSDKTVAVLPFRNAGPAEDEYLAEGLTDDLIDALSMTRGLRVCSRGTVAKWKGSSQDPRAVGSELGVQVVVEGAVRRAPGAVRITARLVSVADGFQLWAKRFDRPDKDLFAINDEAARAIAAALTVDATAPPRESAADAQAVDLYLRARNEYHKVWPESIARAVEIFEQALARAPEDPTILSGYAMARARFNFFSGEGMEPAMLAARRAVDAAPSLPEARLALATVLFQAGEPASAVRELKIALAKGPGLSEAHWLLGRILLESGAPEAGLHHLEVAVAIDPGLSLARRDLLRAYALLGDWAKAKRAMDVSTEDINDSGRLIYMSRMLLWHRDRESAERLLKELPSTDGRFGVAYRLLHVITGELKELPWTDPEGSSIFTAPRAPGRRTSFFAQITAEVLAFLGDGNGAFEAMGRAIDAGLIDLTWMDRCPLFDFMKTDLRFVVMRARVEERTRPITEAYRAA